MAPSYGWSCDKLTVIGILIFTFCTKTSEAKSILNHEPICVSDSCKSTAERLLRNMNQSADPCDSFYEYACGNWSDEKHSVIKLVQKNILRELREILDTTPSSGNSALTKAKRFYQSCLRKDDTPENTISNILAIMDKNGGWPLIVTEDEWLSKNKSWQEIDVAYRQLIDFSPLYKIDIRSYPDYEYPEINFLYTNIESDEQIFSGDLHENFDDFIMLPKAVNYKNVIKNISQIFSKHRNMFVDDEKLEKNINNIVKFEWELKWIKNRTMQQSVDDFLHLWMLTDFEPAQSSLHSNTTNGKIDLLNTFMQYMSVVPNITISQPQRIFIQNHYFSELVKLLDRTPSDVVVNILHWHFIKIFGGQTSQQLHSVLQQLLLPSILNRPFQLKKKWQYCIRNTKHTLPHLASFAYIQKSLSKNIKDQNVNMIQKIVEGMKSVINHTSISDDMKDHLLKKMNSLTFNIGYPDWYEDWNKNETQLNNEYKNLNVSDSYVDNVLFAHKFKLIQKLDRYKSNNYSTARWIYSPLIVNALYFYAYHLITVYYGILQKPFFDVEQPEVVNYSGIGSVIGHEIAHSFYRLQFPYYKNRTEKYWFATWNETKLQYQTRCVVEKYSNYSVVINNKTHHVNSYKTLKENLADIVGVQGSYEAFQIQKKNDSKLGIRLPGLEHLNSNQLFFLAYASNKCHSRNNDQLIIDLANVHTPSKFRIDGTLSSNRIFADTFQCPKGARMNPEKKCDLSNG